MYAFEEALFFKVDELVYWHLQCFTNLGCHSENIFTWVFSEYPIWGIFLQEFLEGHNLDTTDKINYFLPLMEEENTLLCSLL